MCGTARGLGQRLAPDARLGEARPLLTRSGPTDSAHQQCLTEALPKAARDRCRGAPVRTLAYRAGLSFVVNLQAHGQPLLHHHSTGIFCLIYYYLFIV